MSTMIERTVILPTRDNNGARLDSVHRRFQAFLLQVAGGYSAASIRGAWKTDNGKVYHDRSTEYKVLCDEQADELVHAHLRTLCERAKQEALLTYRREVTPEFVAPALSEVA